MTDHSRRQTSTLLTRDKLSTDDNNRTPRRLRLKFVIAACVLAASQTSAAAQALQSLSCGQLWYERNAIFARYGFCFKTDQAINAFGRACFPPYGRLPPGAQDRVNDIKYWEQRRGCTAS